jgi:hypothetical protein
MVVRPPWPSNPGRRDRAPPGPAATWYTAAGDRPCTHSPGYSARAYIASPRSPHRRTFPMSCDRFSAIRRLVNLYIEQLAADPDYHRQVKIADVLSEKSIAMVQSLDLRTVARPTYGRMTATSSCCSVGSRRRRWGGCFEDRCRNTPHGSRRVSSCVGGPHGDKRIQAGGWSTTVIGYARVLPYFRKTEWFDKCS